MIHKSLIIFLKCAYVGIFYQAQKLISFGKSYVPNFMAAEFVFASNILQIISHILDV